LCNIDSFSSVDGLVLDKLKEIKMNIPVLVLLGFAAWTLLTLFASIGVYRWSRILTGRASVAEWRADVPQGSDWYKRAMRAHMNCVENLPVYTAIVVALVATGARSTTLDVLAIVILAGRVGQTLVHIILPPTNAVASLRFALFLVQAICMIAMGVLVASAASSLPDAPTGVTVRASQAFTAGKPAAYTEASRQNTTAG
jgi:uncharacterized MAPEG superfamily protein